MGYLLSTTSGGTHPRIGSTPFITVQPKSQGAYNEQIPILNVSAITGDGKNATLTYQWFQGTSGIATMPVNQTEAITSELPVRAALQQPVGVSISYWVKVNNEGQFLNSSAASISKLPDFVITKQPQPLNHLTNGRTMKLTVEAQGGSKTFPLTYQWYSGQSGDTSNPIVNSKSATLVTPIVEDGTYNYWVQVISPLSTSLNSTTAVVHLKFGPLIVTQPRSQTRHQDTTALLQVHAKGKDPMTYQWEQRQPTREGLKFVPLPNATSSIYTTSKLNATIRVHEYRVIVKDKDGLVATSATAFIKVESNLSKPIIDIEPKDNYFRLNNGNIKFQVIASGEMEGLPNTTLNYQWYGVSPVTKKTEKINGATQSTYVMPSSASRMPSIWVKISNKFGAANSQSVPAAQIFSSGSGGSNTPVEPNPPFELHWNNAVKATHLRNITERYQNLDNIPVVSSHSWGTRTHYEHGGDMQKTVVLETKVGERSIFKVSENTLFPTVKRFNENSFITQNTFDSGGSGAMHRGLISDSSWFFGYDSFFSKSGAEPMHRTEHTHGLVEVQVQIMVKPPGTTGNTNQFPISLPQGTRQSFVILKRTTVNREVIEEVLGTCEAVIRPGESISEVVEIPSDVAAQMKRIKIEEKNFFITYDLLPVEIRDVKGSGTGDDVVIQTASAKIDRPTDAQIAFIEPHGSSDGGPMMPQIEAAISGGPSTLDVEWSLEVKYDRGNGSRTARNQPEDSVTFPAVTKKANEVWRLYEESSWTEKLSSNGFFGGHAVLKMKIGSSEQQFHFRIGGKNPQPANAKQYIESLADCAATQTLWFAYAVAKSESKDYNGSGSRYNQFLRLPQNPRDNGFPLWGNDGGTSPGGYGMFQVTGNVQDSTANIPREQIWNWQKNADAARVILIDKRRASTNWMNRQTDASHANGTAIPSHTVANVTFDGTTYTMTHACTIKAYNGASKPGSDIDGGSITGFVLDPTYPSIGHYAYWHSGQDKWGLCRFNNLGFNYVLRVCEEVEP